MANLNTPITRNQLYTRMRQLLPNEWHAKIRPATFEQLAIDLGFVANDKVTVKGLQFINTISTAITHKPKRAYNGIF